LASTVAHIVWDWNGTLLADTDLAYDAFNASLASAGLDPLSREECVARYRRPLQGFYEDIFGRGIAADEWLQIDQTFQAAYRAGAHDVALTAGALSVLTASRHAGWTQSLLSMSHHDVLVNAAAAWDVTHHFDLIHGHRGVPGATKSALLHEHWGLLCERFRYSPADLVVVGDTLDDAEAATELGARCILFDAGTQHVDALQQTGHTLVTDLTGVLDALDALE
jgi:phosphoglycolate phosphatase-like HAD superfamily hydrolase